MLPAEGSMMSLVSAASLSLVVPVYRSSASLVDFFSRSQKCLDALSNDWEIIFVDDSSPDDSWSALVAIKERHPNVKVVRLAHNHGQQHATLCGLGYVTKDYVITIDDDLQCFPEDISLFFDALQAGKEVVIGRISTQDKKHSWWRNIGSRVNQWLAGKIIGKPDNLSLSSYRGMTRRVAEKLIAYKGVHPHIAALIFKSVPTECISNVNIRHAARGDGLAGTYSFFKLVKTLSYLLINHSYLPLRFMVVWGVTISIGSLLFALVVGVEALFAEHSSPGWASLAVLVSFLSGNILLALGVVGEYLGRLVEEASSITQFSIFDERI